MIRIRSWAGGHPLPGLDTTTASHRVALDEARARAEEYGTYNDVSVLFPGQRAFRGDELQRLVEKAA